MNIVITGASRGIGAHLKQHLESQGHTVYGTSASMEDESKHMYKVDVRDHQACVNFIKTLDRVDVLINNAGITNDKLMMGMSSDDFKDVIDVNLVGTFHMIQAVTKKMIRQKSGQIINMSSVIGVMGNAGQANYAASKAGVIGLTKSAARELASRNILVNAILPGFIETDMTKDLDTEGILSAIPLGRLGTTQDLCDVVEFLINQSYMTGQSISICGGLNI